VPSPHGELDLVGLERGALVVVEVKTGVLGPRYRPGMRVSARDVRRLRAALASLGARGDGRVDLVEVLLDARGELLGFERHRDLRGCPFPAGSPGPAGVPSPAARGPASNRS
jgi:hypothetical protein